MQKERRFSKKTRQVGKVLAIVLERPYTLAHIYIAEFRGGIILSQLLTKSNHFYSYLQDHEQDMLDDLIEFVKKESPSCNKKVSGRM